MKNAKRSLIAILVLVVVVSMTACACKHEETSDAAVAATCEKAGLTEGSHCSLCGEVFQEQEEIPALGHTEEVLEAVEASCTEGGLTEGKRCVTCGEILVEQEETQALGHTTTNGTCERCDTMFGIFSVGYYVDEFNAPTSDGYVVNDAMFTGTFSNSATTDSTLYVQLLADTEDIMFFLYEYGYNEVKNPSSRYVDEYEIIMKRNDGTKHELSGTIYCGGDRLVIDEPYRPAVLEALKSGEPVSFYIVNVDTPTTTYLFMVHSSDFAEEYAKLAG